MKRAINLLIFFVLAGLSRADDTLPPFTFTPPSSLPAMFVERSQSPESAPHIESVTAPSGWVDTSIRDTAWALYVYQRYKNVDAPYIWDGSVSKNTPGTVNTEFSEAELNVVNYYRIASGVRPISTINKTYSAQAQAATLMFIANQQLSHTPPNSWIDYSDAGALGASHSDIALGDAGPNAILDYIIDVGASNAPVGHRRWILNETMGQIGMGDISTAESYTYRASNALYVVDTSGPQGNRDGFIAFPFPGYNPYTEIPARWSFQMADANFQQASVTVTRNGTSLPVTLLDTTNEYAAPAIVFTFAPTVDSLNGLFTTYPGDTDYRVTIANIKVLSTGQSKSLSYDVRLFDPAVSPTLPSSPSVSTSLAKAGDPLTVNVGNGNRLHVFVSAAGSYTNSGDDLQLLTTDISRAPVMQNSVVSSAGYAFAIPYTPAVIQSLTLRDHFVPSSGTTLRFSSAVNIPAGGTPVVQVNEFDGNSWQTIWTGKNRSGTTFDQQTVDLSPYTGKELLIRFAVLPSASYEAKLFGTKTTSWYIDDISVQGGARFSEVSSLASSGGSVSWSPLAPGNYQLAAGPSYFDSYEGPTGSSTSVYVAPSSMSPVASGFRNVSTRVAAGTGDRSLILGFALSGAESGTVVLRGVGPSLRQYNVTDAANQANIVVNDASKTLIATDTWDRSLAASFAEVGAFSLGIGDAAVSQTLAKGSYTMQVQAATGGEVLGEVYAYPGSSARMTNLSARIYVGDHQNGIIGVVLSAPQTVLFRAIGPGLKQFGVGEVMPHPEIVLYDSVPAILASNYGWTNLDPTVLHPVAKSVGADIFTAVNADSALVVTLSAGAYTVNVHGGDGQGGVVLIDAFAIP